MLCPSRWTVFPKLKWPFVWWLNLLRPPTLWGSVGDVTNVLPGNGYVGYVALDMLLRPCWIVQWLNVIGGGPVLSLWPDHLSVPLFHPNNDRVAFMSHGQYLELWFQRWDGPGLRSGHYCQKSSSLGGYKVTIQSYASTGSYSEACQCADNEIVASRREIWTFIWQMSFPQKTQNLSKRCQVNTKEFGALDNLHSRQYSVESCLWVFF